MSEQPMETRGVGVVMDKGVTWMFMERDGRYWTDCSFISEGAEVVVRTEYPSAVEFGAFLSSTFGLDLLTNPGVMRECQEALCNAEAATSTGRVDSGLTVYLEYLQGLGDGDLLWSDEQGSYVEVYTLTEDEPFGPGDVFLTSDSCGFLMSGEYDEDEFAAYIDEWNEEG